MHESERTANLLGAAALAVTDVVLAEATRASGVSTSAAAALVVLSGTGELGVTELGRRVGLTQSAAARMVDSLAADRLVRRLPSQGRSVSVRLTSEGGRVVSRLLAARGGSLAELIGVLDEADQRALDGLLAKLLTRLYGELGSSELLCRLCDRAACTAEASCPVGEAERAAED